MYTKRGNVALGLDISSDFIKVVELEQISEGVKINLFDSINTPPESIKEGVIINPTAVAKAINTLLSRNNIHTQKAIASVRSPHAVLRLSRLPFMSRKETEIALQTEINQYIIFQGKEVTFDFHIVEEISEAGARKMNVLFAVVTKELCNSYLKLAELAEIDLISIDASPLAILRCLSRTNLSVSGLEATMLVVINCESIDICILKGDKVRFMHTVKLDIDQLNKNIDIFTDKIVSALKLVLNFYQAKYTGGEQISNMVLTSDSYSCSLIKEKLKSKFEDISIEISNPLGNIVIDKNNIIGEKIQQLVHFVCVIGSALQGGGLSNYPIRLNLIPKERFERLEFVKLIRFLNIILSAVLAIFLLVAGFLFIINKLILGEISKLQKELEKPSPLIVKLNAILEEKRRTEKLIESRISFLNNVHSSAIPWDRVFASIMAKVPEGLWLEKIVTQPAGVRIAGKAHSEDIIFKFIESFNNTFYFNSAKLVSSQNVKVDNKEVLDFIIDCSLKKEE